LYGGNTLLSKRITNAYSHGYFVMKKAKKAAKNTPTCVAVNLPVNPPRHILVVDDDSDLRQLNVDVLVSAGFTVDSAKDGAEGWEALKVKHYDLLITDNHMPKMSGVELIEKLRSTRVAVPIIMASSHLPTYLFKQKPWLSPDATLQRPFSNDDLTAAVKKVLRVDDNYNAHIALLFPSHL
jgi:DNA-binding response OmpR family regulator